MTMTIVDIELEHAEVACARIGRATSLMSNIINNQEIGPLTKVALYELLQEVVIANQQLIDMSTNAFKKLIETD